MRQPDINRVVKAREHLKAAATLLSNIKWENRNNIEDVLISQSVQKMRDADYCLSDIVNMQEK